MTIHFQDAKGSSPATDSIEPKRGPPPPTRTSHFPEETAAEWTRRAQGAWKVAESMKNPLAKKCMERIAKVYENFASGG